jgi:predicted dehydrogenase
MRIGLVGTGFWARITHAPALASAVGTSLAAVWGRDAHAAARLAAEYGATSHDDVGTFLDAVDAVAFAVPPHVQAPLAVRAAEYGKHLLLEKPLALSAAEADKIVAAAESAGVASVVFFTARFSPEIRAWLTDENASGGWSGGAAQWLGSSLRPGGPFNTPWRREKGGLWDVGPHAVSMLWASLGPVTSVNAVAGSPGVTHLVLRHAGGASSTATVTISAPTAAGGNSLFVWGEAGRSAMPETPVDAVLALRTAASELASLASSGERTHPCDVRFGRDVVRVLAAAQTQLDVAQTQLDAAVAEKADRTGGNCT